jgi:type I restriction enzyme M protein
VTSATAVTLNAYYDDPHNQAGQFDFVLANPPFNVDKVKKERLGSSVGEGRRFPFGLPKLDNANYLWIQLFYGALNRTGRAGFVMANSASDARSSEQELRRKLVEARAVDVMVSVGPNMFYTVALPVTLWFLDRGKQGKRRDQVLFRRRAARVPPDRSCASRLDRGADRVPGEPRAAVSRRRDRCDVRRRRGRGEAARGVRQEGEVRRRCGAVQGGDDRRDREGRVEPEPGALRRVAEGEAVSDEDFRTRFAALHAEFETLTTEAHKLEKVIAKNAVGG